MLKGRFQGFFIINAKFEWFIKYAHRSFNRIKINHTGAVKFMQNFGPIKILQINVHTLRVYVM